MNFKPEALLDQRAYPHTVTDLHLVETHLSWVFLSGEYVYKVKKPVHFDFVDFSTLERRHHFCCEEVRCNREFAAQLYLGVVAIVVAEHGGLEISLNANTASVDAVDVVEYAVRMRQFDEALQADRLLARGALTSDELHSFGRRLAAQHTQLPELPAQHEPRLTIEDNFTTLKEVTSSAHLDELLRVLEAQAQAQLSTFDELLARRQSQHWVRECHGDLHLSNLARLEEGVTAFDCLEFDQSLRHIDVWSDSGFLFMDCCVRGREDLAYVFVDGYLDVSGDYEGVRLLPMYAEYRSVVRAKIAALRYAQSAAREDIERVRMHLQWARDRHARPPGKLWVTCGLSGSGKSYWAEQLVGALPAIRLRSDILRKTQHGVAPLAASNSTVGGGLYQAQHSQEVYAALAEQAGALLVQGENVLIDAACLRKEQRQVMYGAAQAAGTSVGLLYCTAPEEELRARIAGRNSAGGDPSEADGAVLDWQLSHFEVPTLDEIAQHGQILALDTTSLTLTGLLSIL